MTRLRARNVRIRTTGIERQPGYVRIRAFAVIATLSVCLTTAACGGSSGGTSNSPSTTSSARPTVTAPASPIDGAAVVRAAVTTAQARYYRAYRAAAASPRDQALVNALLAVYVDGSVPARNEQGDISYLASHGYVVRPSANDYYIIENITVDALPPAGRATATVCGYDTGVIIDGVNHAPDGQDIIVNNTPSSGRTHVVWAQQADGTWKIDGGDLVSSWEGENRCPARPAGS
ncbi:hypothetical protein I6A60_24690 [Frankia sp. AgB1.9]|uniref:hypothetical protein n=1 Tax=unclassified Frankia TaxID=2632575 RepID=UPI001931E4BB|nr:MULTISPECIES: hypothetical protein [unclassified Frankia]MBL7487444.1 hypothetical protein [Frankia sp. AgW1.1]MBL7551038.1 hypothetical protein [Frankia sp. AgB1.9]MBL7618819.1 hypothetical protein [Frankia sp. AgB1.8]